MSVCMSAVSAGISEVLIKYTGNVWLHLFINVPVTCQVTYPVSEKYL